MEQPSAESDVLANLKWAIHPLGPPLVNAKPWMSFHIPVSAMMYQFTILNDEMRYEFMTLLDSALKAKYLAQPRFDDEAPVYCERATDVKPPIQSVDLTPLHNLNRPVDDSVLNHAAKIKKESRKEKQQARRSLDNALDTSSQTSKPLSDDGNVKTEAAETTKIKNEPDEQAPKSTNLVLALPKKLEEETFSPFVKPPPGLSGLTPHMDSMSVKKRKNEEEHIGLPPPPSPQEPSTPSSSAPTEPKNWSYWDNYHRLPPSNAGYPGVRPSPSTGHWEYKEIGKSWKRYK